MEKTKSKKLPDVALKPLAKLNGHDQQLQKVGMENVDLLIQLEKNKKQLMQVPAIADFFVSLDKSNVRGIHMSRLYLTAQKILEEGVLDFSRLEKLLKAFAESHSEISLKSFASFRFKQWVHKKALVSDNQGWMSYPVKLSGDFGEKKLNLELEVQIAYSSTCPCSASLARQVIQQNFKKSFSGDLVESDAVEEWLGTQEAISATPHSQRSYANIKLRFNKAIDIPSIILLIEDALKTPVQGPVKREDEREFAILNGENPMFCEDAARRIKIKLEGQTDISDYRIHVQHLESLHPFDATAITVKGIENGLVA